MMRPNILGSRTAMPRKVRTVETTSISEAHDDEKCVTCRLAPEVREHQIVLKAMDHFATHGFSGSTRELARQLGVTQPLLYRYFPSKETACRRASPVLDFLIQNIGIDRLVLGSDYCFDMGYEQP